MITVKTVLEFLISIPKLVEKIGELGDSITKLRNSITTKNIEELKTDISKTLAKIKKAESNDELKKLIADLNSKLGE